CGQRHLRMAAVSTRSILDTYRDETGLPVVPAFAAYMIEGGFSRYLDAQHAGGFVLWQAERWEDFWIERGGEGPMPLAPTGQQRVQFLDWLEERVTDIKARQHVEAAA